jgi:hypothetical protein
MAQIAQLTASADIVRRRIFTVSRDRRGRWIARALDGLIEGVFIDRKTAIRFALFEADGQHSAVIIIPDIASEESRRAA